MPPTSPGDAATARALEAARGLLPSLRSVKDCRWADHAAQVYDGSIRCAGCEGAIELFASALASHALAETRRFVEKSVEAASNESDLAVSIALASTMPDKMAAFRRWLRARLAGLEARR